ncbi:unnamed protein product [Blepharisma stoltei]|uniref:Uncharacterized protein n=1 Tax=Blepharisma stoltei TaxID=1481888 RepID=A0AAU9IT44_9CILI|nr:unnamed protein product [Blepharisma stoltei]
MKNIILLALFFIILASLIHVSKIILILILIIITKEIFVGFQQKILSIAFQHHQVQPYTVLFLLGKNLYYYERVK